MPKMIDGRIACRISYMPEHMIDGTGKIGAYYCDHCGEIFEERLKTPCSPPPSDLIHHLGTIHVAGPTVDALDRGEVPPELADVRKALSKALKKR